MALMSSRRFHRFLDELVELSAQGITAETFVQVIVRTVRSALDDPVAQRILHDEPELARPVPDQRLARRAGRADHRAAHPGARAPPWPPACIRTSDPAMAAGWIVRIVLALGAVPAPDDELEETVRFVLRPMLDPNGS